MILIADSGATKTDWLLTNGNRTHLITTEGINPFHQDDRKIEAILSKDFFPQMMSSLSDSPNVPTGDCSVPQDRISSEQLSISNIYFYGAGCLPSHTAGIQRSLQNLFPQASIEINTDLLGAARALCGHRPGIACILGTGANSCLYDGKRILKNISPLGYILGDEGSGAYLGKRFIGDCFKEQLPASLRDGLLKEFQLPYTDIINKVYKEPQANRFLASLTPYIYKVRHVKEVHALLIDSFENFFRRNILPYHSDYAASFTGSISWYFQEEVKEAAENVGIRTERFIKNPIEGMAIYHETRPDLPRK